MQLMKLTTVLTVQGCRLFEKQYAPGMCAGVCFTWRTEAGMYSTVLTPAESVTGTVHLQTSCTNGLTAAMG